jgi:hypothetical protein
MHRHDDVGVCTPTYVLTVIPAKAGIYRQYEAWIPAFAGMTMWLFLAMRRYEVLRFLLRKSMKQKRGDISGFAPPARIHYLGENFTNTRCPIRNGAAGG